MQIVLLVQALRNLPHIVWPTSIRRFIAEGLADIASRTRSWYALTLDARELVGGYALPDLDVRTVELNDRQVPFRQNSEGLLELYNPNVQGEIYILGVPLVAWNA